MNKKFNTYIEAIDKVLENRELKQKWLVEQIIKDEKFNSLQQQLSRWISKKKPVSEGYRKRIDKALDITVKQNSDGTWSIYSHSELEAFESDDLFRLVAGDIEGEPDLDDLPRLIRLRDKIQDKIDKIVSPKKDHD